MKRLSRAVFSLGLSFIAACALAQDAPPTGASTTAQMTLTPTIQARSNLVILDLVVMDRSHHPIRDLKVTDFQLLEGGAAQKIKSFEAHSPATTVLAPAMAPLPPGGFTNYSPTPLNGPVNVLLIDRLNTPLTDQLYLHEQLVGFLRKMKPGTPLAIFGLYTQLTYLRGFSAYAAVSLAAPW